MILLTTYDWIYGITQIAAVILSLIAGAIAISLFRAAVRRKSLGAWRFLSITLILFAFEEVLGTLQVFGVYQTPYLTHVVPTLILGFLIAALVKQITINEGCVV